VSAASSSSSSLACATSSVPICVPMALWPQLEAIVDAAGDSPVYYSLRIYDTGRLHDRRRIRSFFFQEVDPAVGEMLESSGDSQA
jgi:hypothetical protein